MELIGVLATLLAVYAGINLSIWIVLRAEEQLEIQLRKSKSHS